MTSKLNNAQNSTALERKLNKIFSINAGSVSWTSRVKPNLTGCD